MYYYIYTSDDDSPNFQNYIHIYTYDSEANECVICLESKINYSNLTKLQDCTKLVTSCDCNIICHEVCLQKWVSNTQSCPICRKLIISNMIRIELINQKQKLFIITYCIVFYNFVRFLLKIIVLIAAYSLLFDTCLNYFISIITIRKLLDVPSYEYVM